jgi:hypothetical protein
MSQIIVPPQSVQQVRQLVAGIALHRPSSNLKLTNVGFVTDNVAIGQFFLQAHCLYTCWFIWSMIHTRLLCYIILALIASLNMTLFSQLIFI